MSNALQRDLVRLVADAETRAAARGHGRFGQRFHVMPPVGWLNDPNGLCQVDGVFHAYFQYAPFDVAGGVKMWGHVTSTDLLRWTYDRCVLLPDSPADVHGVYSGSALVCDDGRVTMFYTGNVKLERAGENCDYVTTGREANTLSVETADGSAFAAKRLLMTNADYPADLTCHVRDPKVWRADTACGRYLMVQGARRRGACVGEPSPSRFSALHGAGAAVDTGEVLLFASDDLVRWRLVNRLRTPERFGFMWECPDYFELSQTDAPTGAGAGAAAGEEPGAAAGVAEDGCTSLKVLSVSPQGLEGGRWERGNIYQSGYFPVAGDITGACELGEFSLWDAGFDFYAPQTFEAADGRRILIGWMGMPDDDSYGNDPTVADGWQHCLTLPRELVAAAGGCVLQRPVRELKELRGACQAGTGVLEAADLAAFDIEVTGVQQGFRAVLFDELELAWLPAGDAGGAPASACAGAAGCAPVADAVGAVGAFGPVAAAADDPAGSGGADEGVPAMPARFQMRFLNTARTACGCGRTVRWEPIDEVRDVRIVVDMSSVEVFVNGGALVLSTRAYPRVRCASVDAPGASISLWPLG